MLIALKPQAADQAAFHPFGTLLMPGQPDFSCPEFTWQENLATLSLADAEIGMVVGQNTGSYIQKELERHLRSAELIIPVKEDILLVLAKSDAFDHSPRAGDFAAFRVPAGCAAALHPGVWHQAPKCVAEKAPAFVLYAAGTGEKDKQVINLSAMGLEVSIHLCNDMEEGSL